MMKKTKSRAHRFAAIRNIAAVSVLTFTLAFAPVAAQANQSQSTVEPAAAQKKETAPAPVPTAGKENNNRGRLVQEGMTID